jgi:hypothetical protein
MATVDDKFLKTMLLIHDNPKTAGNCHYITSLILKGDLNRKQKKFWVEKSKGLDDDEKTREQRDIKKHTGTMTIRMLRNKLQERKLNQLSNSNSS